MPPEPVFFSILKLNRSSDLFSSFIVLFHYTHYMVEVTSDAYFSNMTDISMHVYISCPRSNGIRQS